MADILDFYVGNVSSFTTIFFSASINKEKIFFPALGAVIDFL